MYFFFFNDTATTEIYTLSLHDALPISPPEERQRAPPAGLACPSVPGRLRDASPSRPRPPWSGRARSSAADRKSTRLNSSHANISYAVFCLKKKKNKQLSNVITPISQNK